MKRIGLVFLGLTLLLAQPAEVQSQLFQGTDSYTVPVDNDELKWVGMYGGVAGPYKGQLNQGNGWGATFTMYCTDYYHTTSPSPYEWTINSTQLADGADMSQTRIADMNGTALTKYRKAVWLATQFNADKSNWVGVQSAIWSFLTKNTDDGTRLATNYGWNNYYQVLDSSDPDYYLIDPDYWREQADAAFDGGVQLDWVNWYVMTDVATWPGGSYDDGELEQPHRQEMLVHATPEPATVVLLLSGLVAVGFVANRRRRGESV